MTSVVIGAGIAGLAAAWELAALGRQVLVLEASDRVGGKLRVESLAGVPVDVGAEAVLARRPEGVELARAAGLELIEPLTTSAGVFVGGSVRRLPPRTIMGIPTDLDATRQAGVLPESALRRILGEPDQPAMPPLDADVGVGRLVRDRFGDEVVDSLVEPMLGGVYAGRADELSLRATVPALAARLAAGGSLLAAARDVVGAGTRAAGSGPVFVTVRGGLGRLPEALAGSGRFRVRTGVTVRELHRTATGFRLVAGAVPQPETVEADEVVVAVPAAKAALLLRASAPGAAEPLAGIESASMAVVGLAYRGADLPAGSGLLVAAGAGPAVKGLTITSQKWPGLGGQLLRVSIGRAGDAQALQRSDQELVAVARRDLRTLIGLTDAAIDTRVTRWGAGLPQYAPGHLDRVARIRAAVAEVPGLAVCGAAYDGVGVPACIASAHRAVAQLTATRAASARTARGQ